MYCTVGITCGVTDAIKTRPRYINSAGAKFESTRPVAMTTRCDVTQQRGPQVVSLLSVASWTFLEYRRFKWRTGLSRAKANYSAVS